MVPIALNGSGRLLKASAWIRPAFILQPIFAYLVSLQICIAGVILEEKNNSTLADFLRSVYVSTRIDLGSESVRQMEISIRLLERFHGSLMRLNDLSEDLLRQFLTEYRKGHSAATVNSKRRQLLALWNCAWEEEYLSMPPRSRRIRRARESPNIPEAWNESEVGRIIHIAESMPGEVCDIAARDWWKSLILTLYDSGARRGAALAVRMVDISLGDAWIVFRSTKTKTPRWAPLNSETIAACAKIYDPCRLLLWPWPHSREWLDKTFRKILRASGVAYGRNRGGLFHKLRRTSATLVEMHGGDGAKHIGDTRKIFLAHYRDPRFFDRSNLNCLPRPHFQVF